MAVDVVGFEESVEVDSCRVIYYVVFVLTPKST